MDAVDCTVWICVDSAGDYTSGADEAKARENYEAEIGPLADVDGFRLVQVVVSVPLPQAVLLTGTAPAEGQATLSVQ